MWLVNFFENDNVERTKRESRWRKVPLKRSTELVLRAALVITRCWAWGMTRR
jgi:hypothetical protein